VKTHVMRLFFVFSVVGSFVGAVPAHAQSQPTVGYYGDDGGGLDSLSAQEQQALGYLMSLLPQDQQMMVLSSLSRMPAAGVHSGIQYWMGLLAANPQAAVQQTQTIAQVVEFNVPFELRQTIWDGIWGVSLESEQQMVQILQAVAAAGRAPAMGGTAGPAPIQSGLDPLDDPLRCGSSNAIPDYLGHIHCLP
jgi:hypothetical protein